MGFPISARARKPDVSFARFLMYTVDNISPEFGRGGGPDPHDHPEVEEDEKEEWEGARRANVLPVTAELNVGGVLKNITSF